MPIQWPFSGNKMPKTYKFVHKETNQVENVPLERWRWCAEYIDGSFLYQFDDKTKTFHQFREIYQSRLQFFSMFSDDNPTGFTLAFFPGSMKLIHFYRHIVLEYGTPNEKRSKLYCFGYEKINGSKTDPYLIFILPNDTFVLDQEAVKMFL